MNTVQKSTLRINFEFCYGQYQIERKMLFYQEIPFNELTKKRKNYTGSTKHRTHWNISTIDVKNLSQLNTFYVNAETLTEKILSFSRPVIKINLKRTLRYSMDTDWYSKIRVYLITSLMTSISTLQTCIKEKRKDLETTFRIQFHAKSKLFLLRTNLRINQLQQTRSAKDRVACYRCRCRYPRRSLHVNFADDRVTAMRPRRGSRIAVTRLRDARKCGKSWLRSSFCTQAGSSLRFLGARRVSHRVRFLLLVGSWSVIALASERRNWTKLRDVERGRRVSESRKKGLPRVRTRGGFLGLEKPSGIGRLLGTNLFFRKITWFISVLTNLPDISLNPFDAFRLDESMVANTNNATWCTSVLVLDTHRVFTVFR